jgi:hypothetical protein
VALKKPAEDSRSLLNYVDGTDREIIELVEDMYGDYMTVPQAWYVAKLLGMYGPNRVKKALREYANKKDPVRYAFSMLVTSKLGKPREYDAEAITEYRTIGDDEKVW